MGKSTISTGHLYHGYVTLCNKLPEGTQRISSGVWWICWWMLIDGPNSCRSPLNNGEFQRLDSTRQFQSHGSRWKVDVRWTSLVDTITRFFFRLAKQTPRICHFPRNVTTKPIYTPCCWQIYQHLDHKSPSFVGKYTIHGAFGKWTLISIPIEYNWLVVWNMFYFP